mmetsp:Transcript_27133/g.83601  ORF Transcript_27133/g.83601 Transcript_27133/m.83601 type:complete len:114 (-) Transcript_27133:59-400(-)
MLRALGASAWVLLYSMVVLTPANAFASLARTSTRALAPAATWADRALTRLSSAACTCGGRGCAGCEAPRTFSAGCDCATCNDASCECPGCSWTRRPAHAPGCPCEDCYMSRLD